MVRVTKERSGEREAMQPLEIEIAAVHYVERSGLGRDLIEDVHVMHLAIGNADKQGNVAVQIDQRVQLDRSLVFTKARPRKHRQAQIDGGRVERIGAALQLGTERIVGIQHAGTRNQNLREVGEDAPIVTLIGIGQRRSRNAATNAHVIQLVGRTPQAVLNVAQTLAIGELREGHAQELVPTGEAA